jgi:hypothetical protein
MPPERRRFAHPGAGSMHSERQTPRIGARIPWIRARDPVHPGVGAATKFRASGHIVGGTSISMARWTERAHSITQR